MWWLQGRNLTAGEIDDHAVRLRGRSVFIDRRCRTDSIMETSRRSGAPMLTSASIFSQSFFHGTRADLKPGDLIVVGYRSNFTEAKRLSWVYFSGTLDVVCWAP